MNQARTNQRVLRVTTHVRPDADALYSAGALVLLHAHTHDRYEILFNSYPTMGDHDGVDRFVVDVGRFSPFDHHQLPDQRSDCAFVLVARHYAEHGDDRQREMAAAMLDRLVPVIYQHDSTGSVTEPIDDSINLIGMPKVIKGMAWKLQDDQATWAMFWPMIQMQFQEEYARYVAMHMPERVHAWGRVVPSQNGRVVGFEGTIPAGTMDARGHYRDCLYRAYPNAEMVVAVVHWVDAEEKTLTWWRGLGSRRECSIPMLKEPLLNRLPEPVRSDVARWYWAAWFAGRGSNTYPVHEPPPAGLLDHIVEELSQVVEGVY